MNERDELNRALVALLKEPDSAARYHAVGILLYQLADFKNAECYLSRAYAINPSDAGIISDYASALYQRQDYQPAADVLCAGLKVNATDKKALNQLGGVYYLLGKYEQGAAVYRKLHKLSKGNVEL